MQTEKYLNSLNKPDFYILYTASRENRPSLDTLKKFKEYIKQNNDLRKFLETGVHPILGAVSLSSVNLPTLDEMKKILQNEIFRNVTKEERNNLDIANENIPYHARAFSNAGFGKIDLNDDRETNLDDKKFFVKWDDRIFDEYWKSITFRKKDQLDTRSNFYNNLTGLLNVMYHTSRVVIDLEKGLTRKPDSVEIRAIRNRYGKVPLSISEQDQIIRYDVPIDEEESSDDEMKKFISTTITQETRTNLIDTVYLGARSINRHETVEFNISRLGYVPVTTDRVWSRSISDSSNLENELEKNGVWKGFAVWKPSYYENLNERRLIELSDAMTWRGLTNLEKVELKMRLENRYKTFSNDMKCAFGRSDLPHIIQSDFVAHDLFTSSLVEQSVGNLLTRRQGKGMTTINMKADILDTVSWERVRKVLNAQKKDFTLDEFADLADLNRRQKPLVVNFLKNGRMIKDNKDGTFRVEDTSKLLLDRYNDKARTNILLSAAFSMERRGNRNYVNHIENLLQQYFPDQKTDHLRRAFEIIENQTVNDDLNDVNKGYLGILENDLREKLGVSQKEFNQIMRFGVEGGFIYKIPKKTPLSKYSVIWKGRTFSVNQDYSMSKDDIENELKTVVSPHFNEDGNMGGIRIDKPQVVLEDGSIQQLNVPIITDSPVSRILTNDENNNTKAAEFLRMLGDTLETTSSQEHLSRCLDLKVKPDFVSKTGKVFPSLKDLGERPSDDEMPGLLRIKDFHDADQFVSDIADRVRKGEDIGMLEGMDEETLKELYRTTAPGVNGNETYEQKKMKKIFPKNKTLIERFSKEQSGESFEIIV